MSQNKIKVKIVSLGEAEKSEPTVTYKIRKGTAKDGGSQHVAEAHCSENGHVGSAYFSGNGDHTHINFLDVHHEHRRKGYGAGLVSHVHDLHKKSNREGGLSYMSTGTRDWNTGKINEDEIENSQGALFGGDLANNQRGRRPEGKLKVKVRKASQAVGRMGRKVLKKFSDNPEIKFVPAAGEKKIGESVTHRGMTFDGYNKPRRAPEGDKKSVVLAKQGTKVRIVRFGARGMTIGKSNKDRKKSYCARSGGIKGKGNKLSANYWSRKAWNC
jgi:GNAT superfamily N-acetyltransferase